MTEQQPNTDPVENFCKIFAKQAESNFNDITGTALKAIYSAAVKVDPETFKPKPPFKSPLNAGEDIKIYWERMVSKRKIVAESAMFKAPDIMKYVNDLSLLKYKQSNRNKPKSNKPPTPSSQQGSSRQNNSEKPQQEQPTNALLNNSLIPGSVKNIHGKYFNGEGDTNDNDDDGDESASLGDFSMFRKNLLDNFDAMEKRINSRIKRNENTANANEQSCREIRQIANNNSNRLTGVDENMEKLRKDYTELNQQVNRLAIEPPPRQQAITPFAYEDYRNNLPSKYVLVQYYQLACLNRREYQTAIRNNLKGGQFIIMIRNDKTEAYTHDDAAEPSGKRLNHRAVELKMCNNVHIKDCRVFKVKDREFGAFFTLDCSLNQKVALGKNIINSRRNFTNDFGLRRDIPHRYNVDKTLVFLKTIKDPSTKIPVMFSFETTRLGYYKILVNDFAINGWTEGLKDENDREVRKRDKCTSILIWNPKDFISIEEKNFTIANLLLLADHENYFCYGGNVWAIPEEFKKKSVQEIEEASTIVRNPIAGGINENNSGSGEDDSNW